MPAKIRGESILVAGMARLLLLKIIFKPHPVRL